MLLSLEAKGRGGEQREGEGSRGKGRRGKQSYC